MAWSVMDLDARIGLLNPHVLLRLSEATAASVVNSAAGSNKLTGLDAALSVVGTPVVTAWGTSPSYTSKNQNISNAGVSNSAPKTFTFDASSALKYTGNTGIVQKLGDAGGLGIGFFASRGDAGLDYGTVRSVLGGFESTGVRGFDITFGARARSGAPSVLDWADNALACVRVADDAGNITGFNFDQGGNYLGNDHCFRHYQVEVNPKAGTCSMWCDRIPMPLFSTNSTGTPVGAGSVFSALSAGSIGIGSAYEGVTRLRGWLGQIGRVYMYPPGNRSVYPTFNSDILKDAFYSVDDILKVIFDGDFTNWANLFSDTGMSVPVLQRDLVSVIGVKSKDGNATRNDLKAPYTLSAVPTTAVVNGKLLGIAFSDSELPAPASVTASITVDSAARTFTRATGSWMDDKIASGFGYIPECITVYGSTNSGNNGLFTVKTVTDLVLTVYEAPTTNETASLTVTNATNAQGLKMDASVGVWPTFCSMFGIIRPFETNHNTSPLMVGMGYATAAANRSTVALQLFNSELTCFRNGASAKQPSQASFPMIRTWPGRPCFTGWSTGLTTNNTYSAFSRRFFQDGVFGDDGAGGDAGAFYNYQIGGYVGCSFQGYGDQFAGIMERIIVSDCAQLDADVSSSYAAWMARKGYGAPAFLNVIVGDSISCRIASKHFGGWTTQLWGVNSENGHYVNFSKGSSQWANSFNGAGYNQNTFYNDSSLGPRLKGSYAYPVINLFIPGGVNDANVGADGLGKNLANLQADIQTCRTAYITALGTVNKVVVQKLYNNTGNVAKASFNSWLDSQVGVLWSGVVNPGTVDLFSQNGDGGLHPGNVGHYQIGWQWLVTTSTASVGVAATVGPNTSTSTGGVGQTLVAPQPTQMKVTGTHARGLGRR